MGICKREGGPQAQGVYQGNSSTNWASPNGCHDLQTSRNDSIIMGKEKEGYLLPMNQKGRSNKYLFYPANFNVLSSQALNLCKVAIKVRNFTFLRKKCRQKHSSKLRLCDTCSWQKQLYLVLVLHHPSHKRVPILERQGNGHVVSHEILFLLECLKHLLYCDSRSFVLI